MDGIGKLLYRILGEFTPTEGFIYVGAVAGLLITGQWKWATGVAVAGPAIVEARTQLAERGARRRRRGA